MPQGPFLGKGVLAAQPLTLGLPFTRRVGDPVPSPPWVCMTSEDGIHRLEGGKLTFPLLLASAKSMLKKPPAHLRVPLTQLLPECWPDWATSQT